MVKDKRGRVALMDKSSRGNASQFFVAGQLCRRGYSAVVTLGHTFKSPKKNDILKFQQRKRCWIIF